MRKISFPWLKNVRAKSWKREVLKLRFEWKIKFFANALLIKCIEINFKSLEFWSYSFLTQGHCKLEILLGMSTFLKPSFRTSLQIVSCSIFTLLEFYKNSLCIRCIVIVISLGISKTWAKNTNFDKASVLKIIILPSRERLLRCHILKTFSIPITVFLKFCSSFTFVISKKNS